MYRIHHKLFRPVFKINSKSNLPIKLLRVILYEITAHNFGGQHGVFVKSELNKIYYEIFLLTAISYLNVIESKKKRYK